MKMKIIILLLLGGTIGVHAQQEPLKQEPLKQGLPQQEQQKKEILKQEPQITELPKRVNRFPVGTYHKKNQNINGLSVGLFSLGLDDGDRNVKTNGIKIEAVGLGLILPLISRSPVAETEKAFKSEMSGEPAERVNGLSLSASGTVCDCITNGLSLGVIGQVNRQVNGVSLSILGNLAQKHQGFQLGFANENYVMNGFQLGISNSGSRVKGLQIGLINYSDKLRGVQIGVWNVNKKRKMPIVNWNFKG